MTRHIAAAAVAFLLLASPAFPATITGTVLDATDQPVAGACVVLCDSESGIPLVWNLEAGDAGALVEPFTQIAGDREAALNACIFETTDDRGMFSIDDLPPGDYKLIAQFWPDAEKPDSIFAVNGGTVRLLGIATVSISEAIPVASALLKPLGDRTLVVETGAPNDETLVVISTAPPGGDPVLGFAGWVGAFNANAIGGNRMPQGVTRFEGLPAATIHIATFSADNSPGWGAASIDMNAHHEVRLAIPFVATWSDAVHSPPPALAELTAKFAQAGPETPMKMFEAFEKVGVPMPKPGDDPLKTMAAIASTLDQRVSVEGLGEHTVGELFAAFGYARIQAGFGRHGREPNPYRAAMITPIEPAHDDEPDATESP